MKDVSAEARAVIQQLAQQDELTPERLVAHKEQPDSPLREYFTEDVGEAAHKRWLDEARALIRRVRVEIVVDEVVLSAPRYTHDPESTGAGYIEVLSVRSDENRSRLVILQELRRAVSALRRANEVAAILGMSAEIGRLITAVTTVQENMEDGEA